MLEAKGRKRILEMLDKNIKTRNKGLFMLIFKALAVIFKYSGFYCEIYILHTAFKCLQ